MEIIIKEDALTGSHAAARVVARLVHEKPNAVIGLATGSTPLMLYKELIRMHREEGLDFSQVITFNLDEYIGLPKEHEQSYHRFMRDNLFSHINIKPENVHIPDGMAEDIPAFCAAYEQAIADAGGIDLQVLGIGSDGHVGFNEPTQSHSFANTIYPFRCARSDSLRSSGAIRPLIPMLIQAGVDILDPVQVTAKGMVPAELKAEFGGKIVFHGGIDTQNILPFGTPDEVCAHVREVVSAMSADGGYIFASSQILSPDIPVENIVAMYDEIRNRV
jgi:glucosamine-6-phosphate deaminase